MIHINESIFPEPIIFPLTMIFRWFFLDRCNRLRLPGCMSDNLITLVFANNKSGSQFPTTCSYFCLVGIAIRGEKGMFQSKWHLDRQLLVLNQSKNGNSLLHYSFWLFFTNPTKPGFKWRYKTAWMFFPEEWGECFTRKLFCTVYLNSSQHF